METTTGFLLRLNPSDRAALKEVARRLQRDRTETLRALIRETLAVLQEQDAQKEQDQKPIGVT